MTELSDDTRALFVAPNVGHVATLLPDGAPHTVPMWVGLEDGRIAFLTSPNSRKGRNLTRDPRVAISITDHANPFVMAQVRGRAERIDGDAAWEIIDRIARAYTGNPYALREDRVIFLVDAEHVHVQSFG